MNPEENMQLKRKLDEGRFVILSEMEPPKGVNVSGMVKNARRVKGRVDAFVVPEMSNAVMRMSSLGGALLLQNNGMNAVMQVNCRDRNRIAIQADLLAAAAGGIGTVMAVTGEDPGFGDHHQARAVHDIDLTALLQTIRGLCNGKDMVGIELDGAPEFFIGSTVNAGAPGKSTELEVEEMNRKLDAGADFFISPPVFDLPAMDPFLKRIEGRQVRLIPTVLLLKSLGMARYISRNMEHIYVPDSLIKRIQKAGDKTRECIAIARETVTALKREGFGGVLVSTLGWEDRLPEIIENV
jgi:5,10-methylenetetrahydrofolate reductase